MFNFKFISAVSSFNHFFGGFNQNTDEALLLTNCCCALQLRRHRNLDSAVKKYFRTPGLVDSFRISHLPLRRLIYVWITRTSLCQNQQSDLKESNLKVLDRESRRQQLPDKETGIFLGSTEEYAVVRVGLIDKFNAFKENIRNV